MEHLAKLLAIGAGIVWVTDYVPTMGFFGDLSPGAQRIVRYTAGGALLAALGKAGVLQVAVKAG